MSEIEISDSRRKPGRYLKDTSTRRAQVARLQVDGASERGCLGLLPILAVQKPEILAAQQLSRN